jgi:hypothetical protein
MLSGVWDLGLGAWSGGSMGGIIRDGGGYGKCQFPGG